MFKKKFLIIIVFLLILGGIAVNKLNILSVQKLEVQLTSVSCVNEQKINEQANLLGKNIFLINKEEIRKKLLVKYLCIDDISLEKKFPSEIKLAVYGRIPITKLASYKSSSLDLPKLSATSSSTAALLNWSFPIVTPGKSFLADKKGVIFDEREETNLPTVFMKEENFKIGQQLDIHFFDRIGIIFAKLGEINASIIRAKITDNNLLIESQQKLIFSLEKAPFRQLGSLQLIL